MKYNIDYDICAIMIALLAIIYTITKKGLKRTQNKILFFNIVILLFTTIFDILTVVVGEFVNPNYDVIKEIVNYVYQLLHHGMSMMYCIYIVHICDMTNRSRTGRIVYGFIAIPYIIDIIVLALNPFTKCAFYYDANNVYMHGDSFWILYFNAFIYMAFATYLLIRYGKNVGKSKVAMSFVFILACFVSVALQIMMPHILLSLCVQVLCIFGVLLVHDNEDEIIDDITGCYNRRWFIQTNKQRITKKANYRIILLNVLQKNSLIATIGMELYNSTMAEIGRNLLKIMQHDQIYYYDNGAFAIILKRKQNEEKIEKKIREKFSEKITINNIDIQLAVGIQTITIGKQVSTIEELLLHIDSQIETGTSGLQVKSGNPQTVSDYRRETIVERAIKRAIENNNVVIGLQPVWCYSKNKIDGAEAVAWIEDSIIGHISSEEMIEVAEKKNLSIELGDIILKKVCRLYSKRKLSEIGIEAIEIRLSRLQLMTHDFVDKICGYVKRFNISPSSIGFQIDTEFLLDYHKTIGENIELLRNMGFHIIINDYGCSAINMLELIENEFDAIRIENSFIKKSMENEKTRVLLKNTVKMMHELGAKVIFEGVDDVYHKELAIELKADMLQGEFFSASVKEESFYRYCRGYNLR